MATLITDPGLEEQLKAQRREWGGDRYDEVWDGVYLMSPIANVEHQLFVGRIYLALHSVVMVHKLGVAYPGLNVTDREDDWRQNYRCPDVVVLLKDSAAKLCDAYVLGGPDFAVEVMSPGDRSRQKLQFYSKVGLRELLLVDRQPWALELYKLDAGQLLLSGRCTLESPLELQSDLIPLNFRLIRGDSRPQLEIVERDRQQRWEI